LNFINRRIFMRESGNSEGEKKHIYRMCEKIISIGDDYWIEDERGKKVFYVDGKAIRLRNTLILKDAQGNGLYKIQEKLLKLRDTMVIKRADGETAAVIKKAFINILGDRWKVEIPDGPDMEIYGNILEHEYRISSGGKQIAEISKKWFSIRDTYGVEVEPGQDYALILAIAAVLDQMEHEE
jgi:uncharacterized protein YxjI